MPVGPQRTVTPPVQRLCIAFGVGGRARYVSGLDMGRAWVRAFRRLGLPLAYSLGFNPQPRVSLAAPLPVGYAAERELLEVFLDAPVSVQGLAARLPSELPPDLTVLDVQEMPLADRPLAARVEAADYVVSFLDPPPDDLAERLCRLLAAETLPFTRVRAGKRVSFDLRPRVLSARLERRQGQAVLVLRLVHGPGGAARPEDLLSTLGLDPLSGRATRTGLVLGDGQAAG